MAFLLLPKEYGDLPPFNKETSYPGEVEKWALENKLDWIIGVDEAGRGPLAGPVHAAALLIRFSEKNSWLEGINDSKKLTVKAREKFAARIAEHAAAMAIDFATAAEIDEVNILQATKNVMARAVNQIVVKHEEELSLRRGAVVIDGNQMIDISLPQLAIVKGDMRSLAIGGASILAKVARDEVMRRYDEAFPDYNFKQNKGYPTREHREAIAKYGPCAIHRKTFSGVKEFLS